MNVDVFLVMYFSFIVGWMFPLMIDLYSLQKESNRLSAIRNKLEGDKCK